MSCVARTETSLVSDHACDSFLRTYVPEACIRLSSREPPFAGRPEFLRKCWPFRRPISCVRPCSSERLSCHSRLRPRDRNCNDKIDYVVIFKISCKILKSWRTIWFAATRMCDVFWESPGYVLSMYFSERRFLQTSMSLLWKDDFANPMFSFDLRKNLLRLK